jgi:sulfate adenylyltransferase large subunit
MDQLRFITCGHVDDGKSTLLGRLLHDTRSICTDQWAAVCAASARNGDPRVNLALLTDGLRAEREQGITIDVAYRYFETPRRRFILADCPGHFEYTRNLVTGASSAQLAVLLIDVRRGLTEQTCRHALLATLLGVRHLVVCVNKMDLVHYAPEAFERVRDEFRTFAARLQDAAIQFLPVSALHGDNVATPSLHMRWHAGPPLLEILETVDVAGPGEPSALRFPVQLVLPATAPGTDGAARRRCAGRVASGVLRVGDELVRLPGNTALRVRGLRTLRGPVAAAFAPMSVEMEFESLVELGRGDLLARPGQLPAARDTIDVLLCWLGSAPLDRRRRYLVLHTTRETFGTIAAVQHRLDVRTLRPVAEANVVALNDLARVTLRTAEPLFCDPYRTDRQTGAIVLVDAETHATVAAGLIL